MAFCPDGRSVISGGSDRILILWDIDSGKELAVYDEHIGKVKCLAVSPDGRFVLSGGDDRCLLLWDIASGKVVHRLRTTDYPMSVDFSPDGRRALIGFSVKMGAMLGSSNPAILDLETFTYGHMPAGFSAKFDRGLHAVFTSDGSQALVDEEEEVRVRGISGTEHFLCFKGLP